MKKPLISNLLIKLSAREARKGLAQSIAIVMIGGLAMTLFTGFIANSTKFQKQLDNIIDNSNYADVYVTTNPLKYDEDDEYIIRRSANDTNAKVEKRFYTLCSLESHSSVIAVYEKMPTISKPYHMYDESEDHSKTNFFMIDETIASNYTSANKVEKRKVGDPIDVTLDLSLLKLEGDTVDLLDTFLKDGQTNPFKANKINLTFNITGIMNHPENSAKTNLTPILFSVSNELFRDTLREKLSESFNTLGLLLIWNRGFYRILNWGDGNPYGSTTNFPRANQYLLDMENRNNAQHTKKMIETIFSEKEDDNLVKVQCWNETLGIQDIITDIGQAKAFTWVFPIVFFITALLIIIVSMRQSIMRIRTQIGTFKAIGLNKFEIYMHVLSENMFSVFLGGFIGLIAGPLVVPSIIGRKYAIIYTLPSIGIVVPWVWSLVTLTVYLGVALLIGFLVIRKEVNLKPVESMRPKVIETKGKGSEKAQNKPHVSHFSMKMVGRNLLGDKLKSIMVIIGVLGCTALLCCGFGIENTVYHGIDTDPFINSGASITTFFISEIEQERIENDIAIQDEEGNQLIYGYQQFSKETIDFISSKDSETTFLNVIGKYTLKEGEEMKNHFSIEFDKESIAVSKKIANKMSLRIGDEITFVYHGEEYKANIGRIFPAFYDNGFFIHSDAPFLKEEIKEFSGVWIDVMDESMSDYVQIHTASLTYVTSSETAASWRKSIRDIMSSVLVMTGAIKFFAMALAAVVLYNLGLMNFKERTREIATLKVLGFKPTEIALSLLFEVLSMTLIGVALGLLIGFPFMKLVLLVNQIEVIDYMYFIAPSTYLIAFLMTFVLASLINVALTFGITKVNPSESLKSVE